MTRNGAILVVAAGLIVTSAGTAPSRPWPPPLVESTAVLTPEVSAALECVWATPTLRRRVHAGSARAPLEVYLAFLDTPEVTAAAARFLKLASYDVHVLDDDRYEGDHGGGRRMGRQPTRGLLCMACTRASCLGPAPSDRRRSSSMFTHGAELGVEALRPRDQDAEARRDARAASETNRLSPACDVAPGLAPMRTTGR